MIATEMAFGCQLWPSLNLSQVKLAFCYYYQKQLLHSIFLLQIIRKILSLTNTDNVLEKIARENNCLDKYLVNSKD